MTDDVTTPLILTADELRVKREALGMSVSDGAARLRLAPKQIELLESGDWKKLPGDAFVRASLRSYSRVLGVDPTQLLAQVGGHAQAHDVKPVSSLSTRVPRQGAYGFDPSGRSSWIPWIALALAAVIGIGLFYGGDRLGINQTRPVVPPAVTVVPVSPVSPALTPADAPNVTQPASTAPTAAPISPSVVPAAPEVQAPAAPVATVQSSLPKMTLTSTLAAWVEVKTKTGAMLFSGYLAPNTPKTIDVPEGAAKVTIGAAKSVKLEWRGKDVDLRPVVKDDVARLTLE
jgi:cytoskeleton protein RodZ